MIRSSCSPGDLEHTQEFKRRGEALPNPREMSTWSG